MNHHQKFAIVIVILGMLTMIAMNNPNDNILIMIVSGLIGLLAGVNLAGGVKSNSNSPVTKQPKKSTSTLRKGGK